ncbi:MAG TPA: putative peptidoglycan glycosyltransferase FtsW, partial [Blastocatellia bacterium]|nr:putative peptidoglycan glycosyltransferase FtsW [Blastocatellia bacterium]
MATSYRVSSPRWKRETGGLERRPGGRGLSGRELPVDKFMLAIVLGLTLFGAVMVYSASAILADKNFGNQFYFLARQARWGFVGLVAMAAAMRIDYRHYKRPFVVAGLLSGTLALLIAVLFFPEINGTHRWITYGGFLSIQPSEISKLALIAFLGFFLENRLSEVESYKRAFVPAAGVAGVMIGLVALEPDLGTALTLSLIFLVMTFHSGMRVRHLATLAIPAVPALAYMLLFVPWRLQRLLDFLDPWKNQTTSSFQVVQSMIAIGSGGSSGVGFAQSKQKLFYLPAPHTDFIFAVIGEELGLIGAVTLVMLFALLAWRGFKTARSAPDMFGQLVAMGLTVMITA